MKKEPEPTKIYMYGFDAAGFDLPKEPVSVNNRAVIQFLPKDSLLSIDQVAGVIIPSGIFEEIKRQQLTSLEISYKIHYDNDLILQRERQLYNLLRTGGWVCFLLDKIKDRLSNHDYSDTDLSKRFLNEFGISREPFPGSAFVKATNDEFSNYISEWGIAKTVLEPSNKYPDRKVIAKCGGAVVGVELLGKALFLPFQATNRDSEKLKKIAAELGRAIPDYLQKRRREVTEWVNEFAFTSEKKLLEEQAGLEPRLEKIKADIAALRKYKGILTQSGEALKDTVVDVLRSFFNLSVSDVEDFKEDALINDKDGHPIAVVEIKGTKQGVKLGYISQLDSHRDRSNLGTDIPGLLIINDFMGVEGIQNRRDKDVAKEQVKRAMNMNVLIVRTIHLLFLMRILEDRHDRGECLLESCRQGGGLLRINESNVEIYDGISSKTISLEVTKYDGR
ncbi:MAG: hypothetical protein SV487_00800 [Thermodesulfobacteriota bacterium]|nr:hypothetical protein [Thermodesulfobacteriota bacterium]